MAGEQPGPRRGRAPGLRIRIERRTDLNRHGNPSARLRLHIGRGLWRAMGSPARVTIQRHGDGVSIAPGDEYAVVAGGSIPRVTCDGSAGLLTAYADGRYDALVSGDMIVVVPHGD